MSSQLSCRGRGVFLGILSGALLRGSLNPDPISDQKCHFSQPFSDLSPKKFMSSLILRLEQQQNIYIYIYIKSFCFFLTHLEFKTNNAFIHSGSSLESHSRFQTKMGKVYTSFQTRTVQNHPLWGSTYLSYGLYKGVLPAVTTVKIHIVKDPRIFACICLHSDWLSAKTWVQLGQKRKM